MLTNKLLWYLLPLSLGFALHASASPIISEFLASNQDALEAADGSFPDWIELQNGGTAVNLAGYTLTDNPDLPDKWTLPAVEMAPGSYLVIFASGDDLNDSASELHTNFSLASKGGYLGLRGPDGSVVSEFVDYPNQRTDVSYGLASSDFVHFKTPTPGSANASTGLTGFVGDTKFSVDRGYYDAPFEVEITTATEGTTIYYTLDGRVPGKGSLFTGPIGEIYAEPFMIDKTSTLRAIAFKDGYEPSNVDTQTYLFLNDVIRQTGDHLPQDWNGENADYEMDPRIVDDPKYRDTIIEDFRTLPALSIVIEPDDFFSTSKGIYPGKIGQDGIDKACSAELLHPDGKEGFRINCAVRIVGQTSPQRWKIKKLSMRLRFDKEFGPGKLNYPLYDDPDAVDEFNTLTVDARHNNTWAYDGGSIPAQQRDWTQYLRDQTAADLHQAMGGHSPHGRYVFTFVNGVFWGMYNLHERPDDAFNASYQGGKRADWEVTRHGDPSNGGVNVSGEDTLTKYREFNAFVRDADDPAIYAQIEEQLDLDDYISYMLVNLGLANSDWGHKNYYVSKSPIDGKWRYHSWDAEKVFQRLNDSNVGASNNPGPTGIHQSLTKSADYRIRFADAVHKRFFNGGVLSTEGLQRIYKRRTDEIGRAVILESARWGDAARSTPYTKENWDAERDRLMNDYFVKRPDIVFDQLEREGLTGDLQSPTFSQHGGSVSNGDEVKINKSVFAAGKLYYTLDGTDPRVAGGELLEAAIEYGDPIKLTETTTIKARIFKSSLFGAHEWSALLESTFIVDAVPASSENLVVSKINYHPAGATEAEKAASFSRKDFEFIELMNLSDERVSLRNATFVRGIKVALNEVELQDIEPGGTVFLVKNRAAFEMRYGTEHTVAGAYLGSLSNDGERLQVVDTVGETLMDFGYNDGEGWPAAADGDGAYLVLNAPSTKPDSSIANSWRVSTPEDVPTSNTVVDPNPGDSDYESWKTTNFGGDASNDTIAGFEADPDGDQVANYLEFVMGGDPNNGQSVPKVLVSRNTEGDVIYDVPLRKGMTVTIERARQLDQWTEVSGPGLQDLGKTAGPNAEIEIQSYRVIQLTKDAPWTENFVRAKVTLP